MEAPTTPAADPNSSMNSAVHYSGKRCRHINCVKPAGTAWSPYWCQKHNAERVNKINRSFDAMLK